MKSKTGLMEPVLRYDYPMRLLTEIDRYPGIPHQGRKISREAVRAIIAEDGKLLLIHATCDGDYKFPGGGIKRGEDHFTALDREVNEETGAKIVHTIKEFGKVVEYDRAIERAFDLFMMTSYYYYCQIEEKIGAPHLEKYESDLGFTPEWISIADALAVNQALLKEKPEKLQRWVKRETEVLQLLLKGQAGR